MKSFLNVDFMTSPFFISFLYICSTSFLQTTATGRQEKIYPVNNLGVFMCSFLVQMGLDIADARQLNLFEVTHQLRENDSLPLMSF